MSGRGGENITDRLARGERPYAASDGTAESAAK